MNTTESFFLPGNATDPGYQNVRDLPHWYEAKAFTESLWPIYRHLADPHFRSDARNHFLQRFWEMYLACSLIERGFELQRVGNEGPEFFFLCEGQRIWVEAIAPSAGTGPDRVPEPEPGKVNNVPIDKILLRYTNALREKLQKLKGAIAKGIVAPDERILLAINSRGIPHAPFSGEMPYIVKALLPFGPLSIGINRETREVVDTFYQYRPEILKENLSSVPTTAFLDSKYNSFVGVLHSATDCANRPDVNGADFLLLHNPSAQIQLPRNLFSWCKQFEYVDKTLQEIR